MPISKKLLLCAAVIGLSTLGGYAVGIKFIERYESLGIIATDLDIAEYRRLYERVSNPEVIRAYLKSTETRSEVNPVAQRVLLGRAENADPLKGTLLPVYRTTRADMRDVGEGLKDKVTGLSPIMGLRVALRSTQPEVAFETTKLLANLVRDITLNDNLTQFVLTRTSEAQDRQLRAEAALAKSRFEIEQAKQKIAELKRISSTYPQSASAEARQFITVDAKSERYLSPVTQMVAEESRILELNNDEVTLQRTLRQLTAERLLLEKLHALPIQGTYGNALADRYQKTVSEVLDPLVEKDDAIRETRATYLANIEQARARWITNARFIYEPTLPTRPAGANRLHIGVLALLLSTLGVLAYWFWPAIKKVLALPSNEVHTENAPISITQR